MGTHPIFESDFDCLTDMGEFESQSLKNEIWEARWEADVRAAKALAVLKNKDEQIRVLTEENNKMRDRIFNKSKSNDRSVLEERLENSGSKIHTLRGQLEASNSEKERILNEKQEIQISCRATQERLSHSESRVSELVSKNAALEQKIKDLRQLKNKGLRECQKEEVLNARNQVIAMQQEVEVLNNKLLGVKTQREALSNQLDSERKIVENERSKRLELGREIELTQEKCLKFEDNKLQLENQLEEQKALVVQLQQLHSDAQHHEQMKQAKISQQKLVVFCQKLEEKRKTEKGVESDLKNEMSRLSSTLCEKDEMISKLEGKKARQDEETIALRFQIQQLLDDAQLCDTKNDILAKDRLEKISQREEELSKHLKSQEKILAEAETRKTQSQTEIENHIQKNTQLLDMVDSLQSKIKGNKSKITSLSNQIKDLKIEKDRLLVYKRSTVLKIENQTDKIEELEKELESSWKIRDRLNNNLRTSKSERNGLALENETLRQTIETLKLSAVKAKYGKLHEHERFDEIEN